MTEEQELFLKNLIECPGPSNHEENVQKIWRERVNSVVADIKIDPHGSNIATMPGSEAISILIIGHADEVGLVVKYINDAGYVYVAAVGGVDASMLPSHRVRILSSKTGGLVPGVVGITSVHLKEKTDSAKLKYSDVWLDIGAANREEAEKLIAIGDAVVFGEGYQKLAGTRATARCFDNRIGLYVVAETMRALNARKSELKATVYGVSSIQEETGVWGARNVGYALNPTLAIAIDVMPCTDSPGISRELHGETKVSGGVVIGKGIRSNKKISNALVALAEKQAIPFQIDIENGNTSTDADPISMVRNGIPIGVLSAPTRYLHSACEVLDLVDLDHIVKLLTEYILSLDAKLELRPGV
ncbi:MAG: M42 family peptidase [Candidatus Kapaibacterium sp.]|jgi:putative aminopeptidase FrvX